MNHLNHWAKTSFVVLTVCCALGLLFASQSSSQDARGGREASEVGRYQYVPGGVIFDTKTARLWTFDSNAMRWNREDAPWEWNQHPKPRPDTNLVPNDSRNRPLQPRNVDPANQ